MRKSICCTLILLLSGLATTGILLFSEEIEDKPILSVLEFETSGISKEEGKVFVDSITSYIIETDKYRVIDRMQRQMLLDEQSFSVSGCSDESCQLEIGRLLSANWIIVGSIGRVGSKYILNIKLIDVETGETANGDSKMYNNLDSLLENSRHLVQSFVGVSIQTALNKSRVVRKSYFTSSGIRLIQITKINEYDSSKLENTASVIISSDYDPYTIGNSELAKFWTNPQNSDSGRTAGMAGYEVTSYNPAAQEIKQITYDASGSPTTSCRYEYDTSGELQSEDFYTARGTLSYYMIPQYGISGNITKKIIYSATGAGTTYYLTYSYNNDGRIKKEIYFDGNTEVWHCNYEYADTETSTESRLLNTKVREVIPPAPVVPASVPRPASAKTTAPNFFTGMSGGDVFLIVAMTGLLGVGLIMMLINFANAVD